MTKAYYRRRTVLETNMTGHKFDLAMQAECFNWLDKWLRPDNTDRTQNGRAK